MWPLVTLTLELFGRYWPNIALGRKFRTYSVDFKYDLYNGFWWLFWKWFAYRKGFWPQPQTHPTLVTGVAPMVSCPSGCDCPAPKPHLQHSSGACEFKRPVLSSILHVFLLVCVCSHHHVFQYFVILHCGAVKLCCLAILWLNLFVILFFSGGQILTGI